MCFPLPLHLHSRPQRRRSFWSAPGIETSGRSQFLSMRRVLVLCFSAILVPRALRFFWSRGRRNGGLWTQPLPDVRNFLTSVSACVVAFNTTAHAHMLILREGEGREFIVMADREKTSTKRSKESLIFIYAERSRIKAI